jgi:hypothetical protein
MAVLVEETVVEGVGSTVAGSIIAGSTVGDIVSVSEVVVDATEVVLMPVGGTLVPDAI